MNIKNNKNKAFMCKKCGSRTFTNHVKKHKCKKCGIYVCKRCMVADDLCADCFDPMKN